MKVLLTTNVFSEYVNREPLGLMYLASALLKGGHIVRVCGSTLEEMEKEFHGFSPELVGYSITTGFHTFFLGLNKKLKERFNFISIFGGPHATFFPEFIEYDGVDIICRGEGEEALLELADAIANGESITNIRNLWVKEENRIHRNPVRSLVNNLDTISHPARELFYNDFPVAYRAKIKSFITNRGCPYACSYCFNKNFNQLYRGLGKIVRLRSVDDVIDEVIKVKEAYLLDLVYFVNDNFVLDKEFIISFRDRYRKEVGCPFHCLVSADLIDAEVASALKDAGCVSVMMGIECGNEKVRQEILKKNISQEKIINAIHQLKDAGIKVCSQNMLGIPGGSLEVDFQTYSLNVDVNVDYSVVSILQPYPGTDIFSTAQKLKLFSGDFDAIDSAYYDKCTINIGNRAEIEKFQKIFAICIELKLPVTLVRFLLKLPLKRLYKLIYRFWKGYCGKQRIFPHHLSVRDFCHAGRTYVLGKGVR